MRGVLCALAAPLVMAAAGGARHAIHSTLTQITYDSGDRSITLRVRAFADDFGSATARWSAVHPAPHGAQSDWLSVDYLTHAITLENSRGAAMRLDGCGVQRLGDLVWLCLRAPLPEGLGGVRLTNRVLSDLFDDEINIVQTEYSGRRASLLFTNGDGAKVVLK